MNFDLRTIKATAWSFSAYLGFLLFGYIVYVLLFRLILRWGTRIGKHFSENIKRFCRIPFLLTLLLSSSWSAISIITISTDQLTIIKKLHSILFIASFSWLLIAVIRVTEAVILDLYDVKAQDNLKARSVYTQVQIFKNIVSFIIIIVATAMILMNFDQVRQLGVSLLASAGIAGIIVGFAAQKSLATVFAGIQIAITQPIRIDDVVIVENEWGWIEEITLTYVVVRIWDLRRLVVPITYFVERPFQNWTRASAEILGSVYIYTDYIAPIEEIRKALRRILEESLNWDGKVCSLQVTGATDKTLELRALMSAANSPAAWDLRCEVREKLITFIKENYPECLPRIRASVDASTHAY